MPIPIKELRRSTVLEILLHQPDMAFRSKELEEIAKLTKEEVMGQLRVLMQAEKIEKIRRGKFAYYFLVDEERDRVILVPKKEPEERIHHDTVLYGKEESK